MVCRFRQIIFFCALIACVGACKPEQTKQRSDIAVLLKEGDVAFRRGNGAASHAVLAMNSQGTYSHIGIIIQTDSGFCVVHEVPYEETSTTNDQIKCESIDQFFHPDKASNGAIYRIDITETDRKKVRNYLIEQLALATPFDHEYDLTDERAQYCTELAWRAFLTLALDISEGRLTQVNLPGFKGSYLLPTDIEANPRLKNIYRF